MAGVGDVAMPVEASGTLNPVPDSPGSPAITETGLAAIMARLSSLEEELERANAKSRAGEAELEKANKETGHLREVLKQMQYGEEEADPSAAMPDSGVPAMPESFLMTLQKPAAEWNQQPIDPPGLPASLEPESVNPPGSAQHWLEKSIYPAGASYYYTTPQKSAGAWKKWSQQGWVDWKGGVEGSAAPLADRWFQSKTDPWTEARTCATTRLLHRISGIQMAGQGPSGPLPAWRWLAGPGLRRAAGAAGTRSG